VKAGLFLIIALWAIAPLALAQNLVRNGTFEEFSDFENYDFGYKALENNITTWRSPTKAGPRIYSDVQTAKSGKVFIGLHCYGIRGYREYISSPLNCRLIAGKTYVFKMYVKLAGNSEFAISSFGVAFTSGRPDMATTTTLADSTQVLVDNVKFYSDSRAWMLVEDSFVATGNEAFMTIGNFRSDAETVSKKVVRMAREGRAYYYLDDVSLESLNGHDPCKSIIDSFGCDSVHLGRYNLIPDPSFECYTDCPSNVNTDKLYHLKNWSQTYGTPDYYNSCSIIMSVPDNIMGSEPARTGHGYVGLYMYDKGNYREFLSAQLDAPLEKERWYVVKLYAALSENSGLCTDAFEFLFTHNAPSFTGTDTSAAVPMIDTQYVGTNAARDSMRNDSYKALLQDVTEREAKFLRSITPGAINEPGNYGDKYTWKKICGMYLADGGERFVTMGNFNDDDNTPLKRPEAGGIGAFAYYYIDDFTIEPLYDSNLTDCGAGLPVVADAPDLTEPRYFQDLDLPELLNDEPFTFRGFYFEFDKFDILDTNYVFLDSLLELLLENDDLSLEVQGHTDDVGSDSYNDRLSKNRALAVVNYLIDSGIDKKRIKYTYFGATVPVASNATAEGRQLNRRCEFILKR
jgi:outer membrane protein OmpA-like peptidoglycan-associated protein